MNHQRLKIAVIGGGVAGITAAHILQRHHDVTLLERNDYIGGHTNTIKLDRGPDEGTPVDTGFIVLNDRTYPTFNRLLSQLRVETQDAAMSFSFHCESSGLCYAGTNLNTLFAQRHNMLRPSFIRMLREIVRFNKQAPQDLQSEQLQKMTLGDYIADQGFSQTFSNNYLYPMAAAIWSTAPARMSDFPAAYIIQFYINHGLLTLNDRPQWKTVVGGSQTYVRAFLRDFRGQVRTNALIDHVRRSNGAVIVRMKDAHEERFDKVVLAAHADQSLALLADPSAEERRLLGAWNYEKNRVVLHSHPSVMPKVKRAWASWNYTRENNTNGSGPVSLTYYMNGLQQLKTRDQYFVSVNRLQRIPEKNVYRQMDYSHPIYTFDSLASQRELPYLNGTRNTYFCGSYFGYGFHEDAVKSGVNVAKAFGLTL